MLQYAKRSLSPHLVALMLMCGCTIFPAQEIKKTIDRFFLPQESEIKRKLDAIRNTDGHADVVPEGITQANADFMHKMQKDPTWQPFDSWHWLVGKLTTLDGNTNFIVKAANHPAGIAISHPDNPFHKLAHGPSQNISRVSKAEEIDCFIADENITKVRTLNTWLYPVSGEQDEDDEKKSLDDYDDQDVVVIEEFIQNANNWNLVRNMGFGTLGEINHVAEAKNILDLHSGNIMFSGSGRPVFTDLENLFQQDELLIESKSFLLRPLYKYFHNHFRNGCVKLHLANTYHENNNPEIRQLGYNLQQEGLVDVMHFQMCVGFAIIGGAIISCGLVTRTIYCGYKMRQCINACHAQIKDQLEKRYAISQELSYETSLEVARAVVKENKVDESREEIFEAFATMALAHMVCDHGNKNMLASFFGKKYKNPQSAMIQARNTIAEIWESDWSLTAKVVRACKSCANTVSHGICQLTALVRGSALA